MIELRVEPGAGQRIVRLNRNQMLVFCGALAAIMLPMGVLLLLQDLTIGVLYLVGTLILLPVLALTATVLTTNSARRAFVAFGGGSYVYRWFGTEKRFTAADVQRVVTVNRMPLGSEALATHYLIVAGPDRRELILSGHMWSTEQLTRIVDDLRHHGVDWLAIREPITPAALRAVDSRLVKWSEANRVAFALVVGLGALLVALIVIVIAAVIAFTVTTT